MLFGIMSDGAIINFGAWKDEAELLLFVQNTKMPAAAILDFIFVQ